MSPFGGGKRKLRVVGENMTMLPGRGDGGPQRSGGGQDYNAGGGTPATSPEPGPAGSGFEPGGGSAPPDDDVPF